MTYEEANCQEMRKLKQMLKENGIQFECKDCRDVPYTIVRVHFTIRGKRWSCIHGWGTYGGGDTLGKDKGLLELYDFDHEPIGYLTAEEVIEEVMR